MKKSTRTGWGRRARKTPWGAAPESLIDDGSEDKLVEPEDALPALTLEELPEELQTAAARAGWSSLMPVQSRALPYLLAERDLMVQSRTGSGKTGAFLLPIIHRINPKRKACQCLILVPTRELAVQVAHEAEVLSGDLGVRQVAVYGGVGYKPQIDAFKQGAHLVIGTPGRVLDHLMNGALSLKDLEILVFDEADRMLSIGFYPDMKKIQRFLPDREINGYLFSATFTSRVKSLAAQFLRDPQFLSLSRDRIYVAETEHLYYNVPDMEKDRCLIRIIEVENPDSALIFCNTRARVHYVAAVLRRFGYDADELTSDLSQAAREKVLGRVRKGTLRFLAATDVAARGIDLPDLSHVFLYEPPEDPEDYIHRAGRTGRAGASGTAISLVTVVERLALRRIAKQFKIELQERELPTDEDVAAIASERAIAALEAKLRDRDDDTRERHAQLAPLAESLSQGEEQVPYLSLLLDEHYEHAKGESLDGEWDLDDAAVGRMRDRLHGRLEKRDALQAERSGRFTPFAKDLAKDDAALDLVTMLLDNFYQREIHGEAPPPLKPRVSDREERRWKSRAPRRSGRSSGGRYGGRGGSGRSRRR